MLRKIFFKINKGQSLVEFSLFLPLILIFIFVTIQLGIILNIYISSNYIVRETARYVAVKPTFTDAQIATYVQKITPGIVGYSNLTFSILPAHTSRISGTPLTVTMSVNIANRIYIPKKFFGISIPTQLPSVRAVMIAE